MKVYRSPEDFKTAFETRMRQRFPKSISRARQRFVFSRLMARIAAVFGDVVTLKGGLALELRLPGARSTKDMDLSVSGFPANRELLLERLQEAGRRAMDDFLTFEIVPDPHHPDITGEGVKYDGFRFRATARLAGRDYGNPRFGLDIAFGNPMLLPVDELVDYDWLGFIGVSAPTIRTYPIETHIAEKLHAYTAARTTNTRWKDLPDLALLGSITDLKARRLRQAIQQTFDFRETHPVPNVIPDPPTSWESIYSVQAIEEELPWLTLPDLLTQVRRFLEPVLASADIETWDHTTSVWR